MNDAVKSDGDLLAEFAATGQEAPFEELVRRHGALVYGACCRILDSTQDAEDATQAVLLTLAHKAKSLRHHPSLAGWLHHVSRHVSLRARKSAEQRKAREQEIAMQANLSTDPLEHTEEWAALKPLLDQELDALPEKYRVPLILHHMEGRTQEDIANLLGCTFGTVSGRLSRARELLRARLSRRGVVMSVSLLFVLVSKNTPAAMPVMLAASTAKAAALIAAGHAATPGLLSAQSAALTEGAMKMLYFAKLKVAAVLVLGLTLASASAGVVAYRSWTGGWSAAVPEPRSAIVSVAGDTTGAASRRDAGGTPIVVADDQTDPKPAPAVENPVATEEQIKEWTVALGSDSAEIRIAAMDKLRKAGEISRSALEKAEQSSLVEIKKRAGILLGALKTAPIIEKMKEALAKVKSVEADITNEALMGGVPMKGGGHVRYLCEKRQYVSDMVLNVGGMEMPSHIVCDGTTTWTEMTMPSLGKGGTKMVMKHSVNTLDKVYQAGNANQENPLDMDMILEQFDLIESREDICNGQQVFILTGKTREGFNEKQQKDIENTMEEEAAMMGGMFGVIESCRIYVGKDDFLLRKKERLDKEGTVLLMTQTTNIKLNVELDDSLFVYCPPAGVTVMDLDEMTKNIEEKKPFMGENSAPAIGTKTAKPDEKF